jgi:predicted nucleic acid-binding Zn ribbon protein
MSATVYKCDQCGQTFNSVNDLEDHRMNEHIKPATEDRFTSNSTAE